MSNPLFETEEIADTVPSAWDHIMAERVAGPPPRHSPRAIAVSALTSGVALLTLVALGALMNQPLLIPPLAASSMLIASATMTHLGQPRAVIGGQLLSACCGYLVYAVGGSSPVVAVLAAVVAMVAMMSLRVAHSPASGTAMIVVLTHPSATRFLPLLALATVILVGVGVVAARANGQRYPDYWW